MIALIKGYLIVKKPPHIVIDVQGVGYELEAPMTTFYDLPALNEECVLYTHFVVRQDAQLLFGFFQEMERDVFRELIRVNGVGPKVALAILSTLEVAQLMACLANNEVKQLIKVPGIGKKTAERLLVELRNRFEQQLNNADYTKTESNSVSKHEAVSALQSLGYKEIEINKAMDTIDTQLSSEQMIKQALRLLSGRVL